MTSSEKFSIVQSMMAGRWWEDAFRPYFSDNIHAEFPFAPPGMLQEQGRGLFDAHRKWLKRTVISWQNEIIAMYPPKPGDETYITIRIAGGDVHWGGQDNTFQSRHITLIRFEGDQIVQFREWSNPLDWLKAAGREVPVFRVSIPEGEAIANPAARPEKQPLASYDLSAGASQARREANLSGFMAKSFLASRNRAFHPDHYIHYVRNVPHEMKELYLSDELPYIEAWEKHSGGWLERMPDPVMYETANKNVFFIENGNYGMKGWPGNNSFGGYTNRYINYLELDDNGFIVQWDEYMNPIAKFNSINVSIPSFPWLY